MQQPKVFLGQDIMRSAIKERSLDVLEEPVGVMCDLSRPILERNDVFTAVRFGLAGLVLQAWESSIVEQITDEGPCYFGGGTISHCFKGGDFFTPHDPGIIDLRRSKSLLATTQVTQGEYALGELRNDLRESMAQVLAEPEEHAAADITVGQTVDAIRKYVTVGKNLGLTSVADAYQFGTPVMEDFYCANNGQPAMFGFQEAAQNPIRFTAPAITYLMESQTKRGWQQEDSDFTFSAEYSNGYDSRSTETMLRDIMMHAARASQRNDLNRTLVPTEAVRKQFSIKDNRFGQPEVYWQAKHDRPIRRLQEGEQPPQLEIVSNRRRNKCPIGYTEKATDPMPLRSIYEAVMLYLAEANLHDPLQFVAPKTIGESLKMVR